MKHRIDFKTLLNPEQHAAATAGDGPLLVLAAAGTGKTRALVYRVAFLVEKGVEPDRILLLTFTNRAAREMVDRAREVVGLRVGNLWSGTFHHVCNRMLRRFGSHLGYTPDFTILDRDDSLKLIDHCLKDLNLKRKDFPKRDVLLSLFSHAVNRGMDLEDLIERRTDAIEAPLEALLRVSEAYTERKRQMGAMDFDDLLANGLRLLESTESVRNLYQEHFRYVLVDEYQDTNRIQAAFVDVLAQPRRNLMVVGDDFQCIYGWRGADYENILAFPDRYPDAHVVKLERNYRSAPEILAVANACIAGNPKQFQKTLSATRSSRTIRPLLHHVMDGDSQAHCVGDRIQSLCRQGFHAGDIAVLYRAHFHSIELQMTLSRARIPFRITSGVGVFEQAHVKDALAFLRIAETPTDGLAFERLTTLLPRVGPRTAAAWWKHLDNRFDTRDPAMRRKLTERMLPAAREAWQPIDQLFQHYHARDDAGKAAEALEGFINGFYGHYALNTYEDAERRIEDLQEVALQIARSGSVAAFLSEVALLTNVDLEYRGREHTPPPAVRLSTVHQAKGLEWPVVLVLWTVEGMFPSSRSLEDAVDDSEERRLFYVAVTRAKDQLELFAPGRRFLRDGSSFSCRLSRFVEEVPSHLFEIQRHSNPSAMDSRDRFGRNSRYRDLG